MKIFSTDSQRTIKTINYSKPIRIRDCIPSRTTKFVVVFFSVSIKRKIQKGKTIPVIYDMKPYSIITFQKVLIKQKRVQKEKMLN